MVNYGTCKGSFTILDKSGNPLEGVTVSYRVGEKGIWTSCGQSEKSASTGTANFIYPEPVFYEVGQSVTWQFVKAGYISVTLKLYAANPGYTRMFNPIIMNHAPD